LSKVTIIGAGSVVFTKNLVADLLMYPDIDVEIWLMDIDEDRLETSCGLVNKIIESLNRKGKVHKTLDRKEALRDAKYVINTVQVGGLEATLVDFDVPEKYGLKQTIADTHGIGGIFRALRTIPVVLDIAKDMEQLCPKALMINYSNPMAMNVWAVYETTKINVVGLCHSIQGTAHQIASYIGVPYESLRYKAAGINHMCWFLELEVEGKNAYPMLFEASRKSDIFAKDPVRFTIMRLFGYFVSESSEHMAEYVPYFLPYEDKMKELKVPVREYVRRVLEANKVYEENKLIARGEKELGELKVSREYAPKIIHSMETGHRRCIHGNVRNTHLITNLPAGCCVEVPCMVDRNGIQPTHVGDLPPHLAALDRTQINVQELVVRAVLERKKEYVYYAALLDPLATAVMDPDRIVMMVNELFEAHKRCLSYLE